MQITAAVARNAGEPLLLEQMELDEPRTGEVRVRVHSAGICHTDAAVRDQVLPIPLPLVLGHEGAGTVDAVGAGVSGISPGDKVVLTFGHCRQCHMCTSGHPPYCDELMLRNLSGGRPDGTNAIHGEGDVHGFYFNQSSFATYVIAEQSGVIKIDPAADLSIVGPLGCGIQTGAGTVMNRLKPREGSSLAVFGTGAVGLAALLAAVDVGCETIVGIDLNAERLELARQLGATHTIDGSSDVVEQIVAITGGGVDFSVDTTAVPSVMQDAFASLGAMGTCALIGLGPIGTEVSIDLAAMMSGGKSVTSVAEGDSDPATFIPHLIELQRSGRFPFDRLIKTFPFSQINEALDASHTGEVIKPVLLLD